MAAAATSELSGKLFILRGAIFLLGKMQLEVVSRVLQCKEKRSERGAKFSVVTHLVKIPNPSENLFHQNSQIRLLMKSAPNSSLCFIRDER